VTLSLAVLDLVTLPDRLVEAVIALSIAAVARRRCSCRPTVRRRWIVSFCFGLVHGFGFSSALRELACPRRAWLSRCSASTGRRARAGPRRRRGAAAPLGAAAQRLRAAPDRGSSVAILLVGLVLFVERAVPVIGSFWPTTRVHRADGGAGGSGSVYDSSGC
jgi:hypothetical protein